MFRSANFWIDALERSLSTGAATVVALVSANGVDVMDANFVEMLAAGGMAGSLVRLAPTQSDDDLLD